MKVYALVDENNKIIQASFQFKGIFSYLIFQTKTDAKCFRDIKEKCFWKGVYKDCKIKQFNLKNLSKG